MSILFRTIWLPLLFGLLWRNADAEQTFLCSGLPQGAAKAARPTRGKDHALVIFATFKGVLPEGTQAPDYARLIFDPNAEGSFSHFYREMSYGALTIEGAWLPKVYVSKQEAQSYSVGGYSLFNREILKAADAETDFSLYDNDGPDERPNSGDDDGSVDFVFINIIGEIPQDFINASASGVASLGAQEFVTNDTGVRGRITIRDGATQRIFGFNHAVGSMAHEYGHALGLPDLYDTSFMADPNQRPDDDSAGIGAWGLMGYGAQGWNGDDGPNPFSAWEREQLGWIGRNNDRLVTVTGKRSNVAIDDVETGGSVYKLPISDQEYFLIENRQRSNGYYDRHIPGEGLLIWHINLLGSQSDETRKMVDLECADGLFSDQGYPYGTTPDPLTGRDNLDFWAHNPTYSKAYGGNTGDATDAFDGKLYTAFTWDTNPNSNSYDLAEDYTFGRGSQDLFSGITVTNIRRRGSTMLADFSVGWSGSVRGKGVWRGNVHIYGDLTIEPEADLAITPGTTVEVETSDDQSGGLDPSQVEIIVAGTLRTLPGQPSKQTLFTSKEGWYGVKILGPLARVELRDVRIERAVDGISGSGIGRLRLTGFTIRENSRDGVHLTGMNGVVGLQDGTIESNGGNGISIEGNGSVDIRRTAVLNNTGTGITTTGVRLQVEGSRILRNTEGGLSIEGGTNVECRSNRFERNGEGYALEVIDVTGGVIQSNILRMGKGLGVRVASSRLPIMDNLFEDGDVGVSTVSASPTLSGNTWQRNRIALSCEGESVPVVEFNTFIDNQWMIRNTAVQTIPATNNWWGTDNAAEIVSRIVGPVSYQPFLITSLEDAQGIIVGQSFPNPFNHTITIPYQVPYRSTYVVLSIYDTAGQLIRVLQNGITQPGRHDALWDGKDGRGREVANGVYICRIEARDALRPEITTARIAIVR